MHPPPWIRRALPLLPLAIGWAFVSSQAEAGEEDAVSYNFQIRPLLATKCLACHGADAAKRKADLRLDDHDCALKTKAVVPGDPEHSGVIERITSTDEDEVMPPPKRHNPITDAEKDLLVRWIKQGAPYEQHWSFVPPKKPALPPGGDGLHPIDALVRSRLAAKGWTPAPEAPREEWLRRVTLALTGLPPTPAELDAFLADSSPEAHGKVVDRLLASPRFGEQMAVSWLDAARFGDTYGRHEDADSDVWPWRDWVIRAFNENLPYDQFIQWQIAGDLLPNPTQDQVVATAFQRLPVQSNESGSDPEEFRWDQVFDRVKTTSTAVLGLTLECARCHDHKYDPFTMRDYYRFAAYLNNIDELGLFARFTNGIPAPTTFVYRPGEKEEHEKLRQAIESAESALAAARHEAKGRYRQWLEHHAPPGGGGLWEEMAHPAATPRPAELPRKPDVYVSFDLADPATRNFIVDNNRDIVSTGTLALKQEKSGRFGEACLFPKKGTFPRIARYLRWQPFSYSFWLQCPNPPEKGVILHRSRAGLDAANRGYEITFEGGKLTATLGHFYPGNAIRVQLPQVEDFHQWRHVAMTYDGSSRAAGLRLFLDGQEQKVDVIRDHLYKDIDYLKEWGDLDNAKVADAESGELIMLTLGGRTLDSGMREGGIDELRAYDTELSAVEVAGLAGLEQGPGEGAWFDWYAREIDPPCRKAQQDLMAARKAENELSTHLIELMVMQEQPGPRRATPMLTRGDFRQPGEIVEAGVLTSVLPQTEGAPGDRRALARWLTEARHPLTSRVEVNRLWSVFFGRGIVATPEDFGLQGSIPANPELLDWLAVRFVEGGWNIKSLCKEIVLSRTYRQSSIPRDPAILQDDPNNIQLARGPRFRLPAEQLRDAALATSGLLNPTLGGPSVRPYQPAGLWEDSGTQHNYVQDKGDKLYRRSLYTFWRRTCPPPVLSIFDAPTREFCRVRRESSMTPLQALALMNDTGFLEASRVLAEKLVRAHPATADGAARVSEAFRLLASRPPTEVETKAMTGLMDEARAYYAAHPEDAGKLLDATGESPKAKDLPVAEVAATLLMARDLYSSDAFVITY